MSQQTAASMMPWQAGVVVVDEIVVVVVVVVVVPVLEVVVSVTDVVVVVVVVDVVHVLHFTGQWSAIGTMPPLSSTSTPQNSSESE